MNGTGRIRRVLLPALLLLALGGGGLLVAQTRQVTVEALIYDLKHPDETRRREAAIALGQNQIPQAVPALIEATRDSSAEVRLEAVRALLKIRDRRALTAYIERTADSDRKVREKAVQGIIDTYVEPESGFGSKVRQVAEMVNPFSDDFNPVVVEPYVQVDPRAVQALTRLLAEGDHPSSRRQAAEALGILRDRSALGALEESLGREENTGVKVEAIRAIYKIGDREAARVLIPYVDDPEKKVHDEAIYALGRLRVAEAVPPLKQIYESGVAERRKVLKIVPVSGKDDLQRNVYQALSYIAAPDCRELFLAGLADERAFYRRYGAEGLARLGESGVVTEVARAYVREPEPGVRLAMSYALLQMGREEHLDELVVNAGRDQALHYLLELDAERVRLLYPHLKRERDPVKIRLLDVIGQRADQSAIPHVQTLAASENTEVVAAANLAMRRLNGRLGP